MIFGSAAGAPPGDMPQRPARQNDVVHEAPGASAGESGGTFFIDSLSDGRILYDTAITYIAARPPASAARGNSRDQSTSGLHHSTGRDARDHELHAWSGSIEGFTPTIRSSVMLPAG